MALAAILPWLAPAPAAARDQPNIVIVLADDLGWNDVGFHGGAVSTPVLDALAEEGVRLTNMFVTPQCTPTRAALLTGQHPHRFGFSGQVVTAASEAGLPPELTTIAEYLRDQGYFTSILGKWHLGHAYVAHLPLSHGFDHHYGHYQGHIDFFEHTHRGVRDWHRDGVPVIEEGHATELLAEEAERLIREHDFARPLFLYAAFSAPHSPHQAPPEDVARFAQIEDPVRRRFVAQVYGLDRSVGRIAAALEARGEWERTFFVFLSDNGGATTRSFERGDNRPLRGQKGTLYNGGIRVPAVLSYPAGAPLPGVSDAVLSAVDIFPTAMRLAAGGPAAPQPASGPAPEPASELIPDLDGIDMLALLRGEAEAPESRLLTLDADSIAFTYGPYKVMRNPLRAFLLPYHDTEYEVYDLVGDPLEHRNLIAELSHLRPVFAELERGYRETEVPSLLAGVSTPPEFVPPMFNLARDHAGAVEAPLDLRVAYHVRALREGIRGLRTQGKLALGFALGAVSSLAAIGLVLDASRRARRRRTDRMA